MPDSPSMHLSVGYGPVVTTWDAATSTTVLQCVPGGGGGAINNGEKKGPSSRLKTGVRGNSINHEISDLIYSANEQVIATCSISSHQAILSSSDDGAHIGTVLAPPTSILKAKTPSTRSFGSPNYETPKHDHGIPSLDFGAGGRYLGLTYRGSAGKAFIYNIAKNKFARSFVLKPFTTTSGEHKNSSLFPLHSQQAQQQQQCHKVLFDPTNQFLSCLVEHDNSERSQSIQLFRLKDGDCSAVIRLGAYCSSNGTATKSSLSKGGLQTRQYGAMAYSQGMQNYLAAGVQDSVAIYDINQVVSHPSSNSSTATPLHYLERKHEGVVTSVSFNPMSKTLVASSSEVDGSIAFHDIQSGRTVQSFRLPLIQQSPPATVTSVAAPERHRPTCMQFHSNGVSLAIGSNYGRVFMFDLRKCDMSSHPDAVATLDMAQDNAVHQGHQSSLTRRARGEGRNTKSKTIVRPISCLCFRSFPGSFTGLQTKPRTSPAKLSPDQRVSNHVLDSSPTTTTIHTQSRSNLNKKASDVDDSMSSATDSPRKVGFSQGKAKEDASSLCSPLADDSLSTIGWPEKKNMNGVFLSPGDDEEMERKMSSLASPPMSLAKQQQTSMPHEVHAHDSLSGGSRHSNYIRATDAQSARSVLPKENLESAPRRLLFPSPVIQTTTGRSSTPLSHDVSPASANDIEAKEHHRMKQRDPITIKDNPKDVEPDYSTIRESRFLSPPSPETTGFSVERSDDQYGGNVTYHSPNEESFNEADVSFLPIDANDSVRLIQEKVAKLESRHKGTADNDAERAAGQSNTNNVSGIQGSSKNLYHNDMTTDAAKIPNYTEQDRVSASEFQVDGFLHQSSPIVDRNWTTATYSVDRHEIHRMLDETATDLRHDFNASLMKLHIDMLRQFQAQSNEMKGRFEKQNDIMLTLLDENQKLRDDNERLLNTTYM